MASYLRVHFLVAERGFLRHFHFSCMVLTASEIYRLSADKLLQLCSEEGLNSEGAVRLLRHRLVRLLKAGTMAIHQDVKTPQASVSTDLSVDTIHDGPQSFANSSHVGGSDNPGFVFVELLRQVPSLSSEEPKAIFRLMYGLEEIYALGLTDDMRFVFRILP